MLNLNKRAGAAEGEGLEVGVERELGRMVEEAVGEQLWQQVCPMKY